MIEKNTQQVLKYKPSDVVTLTVARLGEMGAFLDAGTGNTSDDILLHKLQQTEEIKEGDKVKVYLYLDPNKRLTASMKLPKMREGQLGYVKVLSVTRDGGFVDIGAERGVFLPYSQMKSRYQVLRKCPILLPFVWLVRWFEILFFRRYVFKFQKEQSRMMAQQKMDESLSALRLVGLDIEPGIAE